MPMNWTGFVWMLCGAEKYILINWCLKRVYWYIFVASSSTHYCTHNIRGKFNSITICRNMHTSSTKLSIISLDDKEMCTIQFSITIAIDRVFIRASCWEKKSWNFQPRALNIRCIFICRRNSYRRVRSYTTSAIDLHIVCTSLHSIH